MTTDQQPIKPLDRGKRYSKEFKFSVLSELRSGVTQVFLMRKYGMSNATLIQWIRRYGTPDIQCQRKPITDQQRREGARAILEGRMTVTEVMSVYEIVSKASITRWIKDYKKETFELTTANQVSNKQIAVSTNGSVLEELSYARLKIAALETMIDVAEEQFKISIRKKPGAKQRRS